MRKWAGPLAGLIATLHLTLSVSAPVCFLTNPTSSHSSHHHHDKSGVAHSALCLWVCQAHPTVNVPGTMLPTAFRHVVALLLVGSIVLVSAPFDLPPLSRAPPHP
jgi:hypothetical protein